MCSINRAIGNLRCLWKFYTRAQLFVKAHFNSVCRIMFIFIVCIFFPAYRNRGAAASCITLIVGIARFGRMGVGICICTLLRPIRLSKVVGIHLAVIHGIQHGCAIGTQLIERTHFFCTKPLRSFAGVQPIF